MSHLNPRPPTAHGFVEYRKCGRCGTERPATHLAHGVKESAAYLRWLETPGDAPPDMGPAACIDTSWCNWQAKEAGK